MKAGQILIISFAFLLGCATPEKLIDRAIKKDPTILTHTTDTLREIITVVDSFAYVVNDSIFYETIVREIEVITVTNNNGIEIERKKTRLEVRKSAQLEKLIVRKDAKIRELELKNEKTQSKLDAETEQKANKQAEQTARTTTRKENKKSNWWTWLIIGGTLGLCLGLYLKTIFSNIFAKAKTFLLK